MASEQKRNKFKANLLEMRKRLIAETKLEAFWVVGYKLPLYFPYIYTLSINKVYVWALSVKSVICG
jgi:hypothetical protein